MKRHAPLLASLALVGLFVLPMRSPAQQGPSKTGPQHDHSAMQAEKGAVQAMTPGHAHHGAHIRLTEPRALTPEDRQRADALVGTLRESLEKYRDYRVAVGDGYQPFLPEVPLPEHHFTNYRIGFEAAFWFDPARPTSLLYRKVPGGWELVGAMYTAPRLFGEDRLHERVPLSVARWHAHVNICLPQRDRAYAADWTKFGPQGSIVTEEACREAGGRWVPQLFGWMVHVYPWEKLPEKVWGDPVAPRPETGR